MPPPPGRPDRSLDSGLTERARTLFRDALVYEYLEPQRWALELTSTGAVDLGTTRHDAITNLDATLAWYRNALASTTPPPDLSGYPLVEWPAGGTPVPKPSGT